jgi:hypothetical protein
MEESKDPSEIYESRAERQARLEEHLRCKKERFTYAMANMFDKIKVCPQSEPQAHESASEGCEVGDRERDSEKCHS